MKSQNKPSNQFQDLPNPNDDLLKWYPLVKNLAMYFHKINRGSEIEDLIQEGWVGLLMGMKKYNPNKNITIGAYCKRWIFGRIYRSILGTKNLKRDKHLKFVPIDEGQPDISVQNREKAYHLNDFIENSFEDKDVLVLKMIFKNYKKNEILRSCAITEDEYNAIIEDFNNRFE